MKLVSLRFTSFGILSACAAKKSNAGKDIEQDRQQQPAEAILLIASS